MVISSTSVAGTSCNIIHHFFLIEMRWIGGFLYLVEFGGGLAIAHIQVLVQVQVRGPDVVRGQEAVEVVQGRKLPQGLRVGAEF